MAIWVYRDTARDRSRVKSAIDAAACIYCGSPLDAAGTERTAQGEGRFVEERYKVLRCCKVCGWWIIKTTQTGSQDKTIFPGFPYRHHETHGAAAVLRDLDLSDQTLPLTEIRQYLAARYDDRFHIDAAKFEDVVVSVYRDLGYDVEATGRTGDGGIDAVVRGPSHEAVGVQVKRYKGKIEAHQIREFAGALYLQGMLGGIYVTTSDFTAGAHATAEQALNVSLPVELVNAERFYQQLGLAQRHAYDRLDDPTAPFANANLLRLESETTR